MDCHACAEATWDGAPDAADHEGYRQIGESYALTGLLACLHQPR